MEKENLIESAKGFVHEHMKNNDPSHDWLHVERVYKNALYLAEQENGRMDLDLEVVKLGALFHDLVDFKYNHDSGKSLDEVSRDRLNEFFAQFDTFPRDKIDKVHYIIMNVSWRKELEAMQKGLAQKLIPELRIVRDADRLDALGAIGVSRCFSYTGTKNRPYYDKSELGQLAQQLDERFGAENTSNMISYEKYNQQTVRNEGTALGHFFDKLFYICERMQTETGKRLANERHEFMKKFVEQFINELV